MGKESIKIPEILLNWTDWVSWKDIEIDEKSGGVKIDSDPGVYEVKIKDSIGSLTIGKTADLNKRVRRGLVQSKLPHSSGKNIHDGIKRGKIDSSKIIVRWAKTSRPAAAEEALHDAYFKKFRDVEGVEGELKYGKLPNYIKNNKINKKY